MRADRLVATLLYLQSRGRVTAAELAAELEVSVKTARRDLEALAMSGIPVYPQTGRNGGWQLLGGARTDLSGLTAAEARTLFMVAGPASTATPEAKAALRKLVQALPETFRAEAEAAAASTVLDAAHWGREAVEAPEHLDTLRAAVVAGAQVRLTYADRTRAESERVIHPLGVVEKGSTWYVVADTAKGQRTFRVNRVRGVEVLEDRVVRPEGFDLAEAWASIVTEVEAKRATSQAIVRIGARKANGLRGQFGPTTQVIGPAGGPTTVPVWLSDGEELVDVAVGAPSEWSLAEQLSGWAGMAEVVSPESVREKIAVIGRRIVDIYG